MQDFKDKEFISSLLQEAKFGLWKMEVEKNKGPKIYFDKTALDFLGFKNKTATPEEVYADWLDRVADDSRDTTKRALRRCRTEFFLKPRFFGCIQ